MAKAKSKTRYNLGYGAIYQRKTKNGMIRWYIDYRDEFGTRVQRVVSNARSQEEAMIALQAEIANIFAREHNLKVKSKRIRLSTFIDDFVRITPGETRTVGRTTATDLTSSNRLRATFILTNSIRRTSKDSKN